jgi:iron complex outermembrane receptor protein
MKTHNTFLLSSMTLAILALMDQASAQDIAPADAAPLQRVEITGSSIKRVDAEDAMPVTTIKAEEFAQRGFTTLADVLDSLTVGSSQVPGISGAGSVINLRGIGLNRTLVLLNGQRLANEPTQDAFINVDIIPMNALDRIEILRDGASSTYGSDAIGGVINFITKRSYEGLAVTAQAVKPQESGGANEQRISLIGGKGDLERDGWSLYGTLDLHRRSDLPLSARPDATNNDILNSLGIGPKIGAGAYAYPANIISPITGNPYASTGCIAPYSSTATKNTCINNNNALYALALPKNSQTTFFSKGSLKLNEDNTLSMEVLYGDEFINIPKTPSTSVGFTSAPGGPAAQVMTITKSSPYYPGGSAGVPAIAGVTGQPLTLEWQGDVLGPAVSKDEQKSSRALITEDGHALGWDYKVNLDVARDERISRFQSGYINGPGLDAGVLNGIINPFGAQSAAGQTYLDSLSENGQVARDTTVTYDSINVTGSRDLAKLAGGALALAVGGDFHHDSMHDIAPANDINVPYNGRNPYDVQASRNVGALFAEIDAPVTKELDLDFAVRADNYSDFGHTVNPKASFRYQPSKRLMFRGSFDTGFRAPSLIDRYGYRLATATTTTANKWDDPLLCPGTIGQPGTGTALPGYATAVVCNAKQNLQAGSNPNVQPEHAKDFTVGVVMEPVTNMTVSVDYWKIHLRDTIGSLSDTALFDNPAKYASSFVRNADGSLAYVVDTIRNLGDTITSGEDITVAYAFPQTSVGKFTLSMDGTYTNQFEFQTEKNGAWIQNVGQFGGLNLGSVSSNAVMTFRWKHNLRLQWAQGPWTAQVSETFQTGYHDGTAVLPQYYRDISSFSLTNLTATYTGFKHITLMGGINNLFNRMPPLTNSLSTGYLSSYASPIGRAYSLTGTYKF